MSTTARRRATRISGIKPFDPSDRYGRKAIPETAAIFGERRQRRLTTARLKFFHRAKNGCFDPFSFFHVTDTILNVQPDTRFTSAELAEWLNQNVPQFEWDAVTVGRILNDMRDTFVEVNGTDHSPIRSQRAWDGTYYWVSGVPEHRAALAALLDDLTMVGTKLHDAELRGEPPKRLTSPLAQCPSVAVEMDLAM